LILAKAAGRRSGSGRHGGKRGHDHDRVYDPPLHPAGVGFVAPKAKRYAGLPLDPALSRGIKEALRRLTGQGFS